MNPFKRSKFLGRTFLLVILFASSMGLLLMAPSFAASSNSLAGINKACALSSLPSTTLVSGPPTGAKSPDDLTIMAVRGLDNGNPLLWTEYQNGIDPDGTPGTPGGPTQSTIAGYNLATGTLVMTIPVTGHVDGLTADPALGALIATANEDDNSNFNLVYPAFGAVATYIYSPNPAVESTGGTDSIAIVNGQMYVSHSNPLDTTQATTYRVTLDKNTLTAYLTPVFYDNSKAFDVNTFKIVQMALTDPDTNYLMPPTSPLFAGTLATISQGDGKIIFAAHPIVKPHLFVLSVTDNVPGNVPPIDGLAVATASQGTLYIVDSKAQTISALNTEGCPTGTTFVGEPNDNSNPFIGTLNLLTGKIAPLGNSFMSPKGMLFVPALD